LTASRKIAAFMGRGFGHQIVARCSDAMHMC
jgi:hypothetical protein